jgi:glucosamine 6-phosphate synthetase-like amidotransferase/phosphosugar isomerase protein
LGKFHFKFIKEENMDLKTAMMNRIMSMQDRSLWEYSLKMSRESMKAITDKHDLSKIDHIYLVGCGTSLANAQIGASFIEGIAHISAEAEHAFSFSEYIDPELLGEHKAVLGITGAGVTTSVERSLKTARSAGALTIAVTGAKDSTCALAADEVLMTDALNEGPTVRTISNIFMQLGLYVFATALGEAKGTIDAQKGLYWDAQLDLLISKVPQVLKLNGQITQLAEKYHALKGEMVIVLGAGPNFGTAWEGSLMAVEMSWIDSAGYEMEEFTHGRFRECDERKPIIFIAPHGKADQKLMSILNTCNKANAPAVVLTDVVTDEIRKRAADIVLMPGGVDEVLTPFLYVFPLWLFDYATGILRGVDPASQRYGINAADINLASI